MDAEGDIVEFRLRRSNESFEEALLLFKAEHYNTANNRLYYSAFYALLALLMMTLYQ